MKNIIQEAMRLLREEHTRQSAGDATETHCHWLDAVPASLLHSEATVVNYLCMLVAIDFQHWAQIPRMDTPVGEVVEGFGGFYAVVHDEGGLDPQLLEVQHEATPTLVRGSAAMLLLLKRAVEEHQIHWYDTDYLSQFLSSSTESPVTLLRYTGVEEALRFSPAHPTLEAVKEALRPCFLGCERDGQTPLWMPATEERIQVLLSLAETLKAKQTTFYDVFGACNGKLFLTPESTADEKPFIPALLQLHYRYQDFGVPPTAPQGEAHEASRTPVAHFPILKLSQLTACSLLQTLPVYWSQRETAPSDAPRLAAAYPWLHELRQRPWRGGPCAVFDSVESLSICCDYQIPKLLRAAGLLQYDETLSHLVDTRRLLAPNSTEEVSIRIATLVACEVLASKIAESYNSLAREQGEAHSISVDKAYTLLDPLLWLAGRSLKGCEHHLCHTIMY